MAPRPSSVIVPVRGRADTFEVLWSQRRYDMKFLGGFYAFFGGALEEGDASVPLSVMPPEGSPAHEYYGCAARELFEESGVYVGADGVRLASEPRVGALRTALLKYEIDFSEVVDELGVIDSERFSPLGEWITPEFSAIRFQTEFFAVRLDDELESYDVNARIQPSELMRAEWVSPQTALARWLSGELYISQPIRFVLEALELETPEAAYVDESSVDTFIDYARVTSGISMLPQRSATIPPATHTNTFIVGDERFVVIDPGSDMAEELEILHRAIGEAIEEGREAVAIVLTHHHPDHVDGVAALAERWGLPVWGHHRTGARLASIELDRLLNDGEKIELGADTLECLFTPGHADGHLSFYHARTNSVLVGDLVTSQGTILIDPRDGHMGDYLESLRRVRDLGATALFPAHGWIITNPEEHLSFYIEHRLAREEKVFGALMAHDGPTSAADLVPDAYDDVPKAVWPLAARSVLSHLIHLVEVGRAKKSGDSFLAAE